MDIQIRSWGIEVDGFEEDCPEKMDLTIVGITPKELVSLLHILERAVSTNNKAEEFLEGLKKAIDKALPKN